MRYVFSIYAGVILRVLENLTFISAVSLPICVGGLFPTDTVKKLSCLGLPRMYGGYSYPFTAGARNGIFFPYARGYSSIGILLKFSIQSSYIHVVILGEQFQN